MILLRFATNLTKNVPNPRKGKKHHDLFLKGKDKKNLQTLKNWKKNNVDVNSVTVEHPKTGSKLSKPIKQWKIITQQTKIVENCRTTKKCFWTIKAYKTIRNYKLIQSKRL